MNKYKYFLITALIVVCGFLLRFFHNTDISLWHDEAFSALLIKYPVSEMIYRIGLDVHPPAYYFALRLWHYFFTDSLISLRMFSVVFGLASVYMTFLLAKSISQKYSVGIIAAILVAINPFQIEYATEARMYTFGAFLGLAAAYLLVKAIKTQANELYGPIKSYLIWVAFGAVSAIAALTHYYLLFTVSALGIYALGSTVINYKKQLSKYLPVLLSFAVIGIAYLPWLNWFFYQVRQVGQGYWIPGITIWSIPTTIWQILVGKGLGIDNLNGKVLVIALTVVLIVILWKYIRLEVEHKWLVLFGFLAPFAGSLLFWLLSIIQNSDSSVYLVRYFLYASGFLSIILATWLSSLSYKKIALLLLFILILGNAFTYIKYWKDLNIQDKKGMNALTSELKQKYSKGDKVIAASNFEFFNLKYYLSQKPKDASKNLIPVDSDSNTCHIDCLDFWVTSRPLLFSGGRTSINQMSHFEGTAILTDQELFPHLKDVPSGTKVWIVWTNGFGGSKPEVPNSWTEVSEHGYAEVKPYVGTWVVLTEYLAS